MDESVVDSPSRLRKNVETHAGHSETAVEKNGVDKNSRRRRMSASGRKDVLLEQITARERGLSEVNPEEHRAFPFGDAASVLEEARKQSSVLSHPNEKPVAMADVMALMKSIASSLDDLNDRIRELQAVTLNPSNTVSIDADLITSDSKTPDVQKTPKGPQRRMSFSSLCRRSSSRPTRLKHSPSCSSCTSLEPLEAPLQAMSIDEQHD
ncbi:hypothetical protein AB1Y20_020262 [Prymnesium parvum]|uniref:Uncharacterized protein n=1 Tax=Prymnesium parvum TaxID=97485 RepID=A0AB34JWL1_PRYPA